MNINGFNPLSQGSGAASYAQSAQNGANTGGRAREAAANATPSASRPASPPNEARGQHPAQARPVLDVSDTALIRRDIPRGSIIDIVA
jgi:hypothetical protein